jgi:GrpB-like predicted nucleotidyltransferase (UPF0157 family)
MLGIPKESVMLCPYSQDWKILFEQEKTNLYNCFHEHDIEIQHVGST